VNADGPDYPRPQLRRDRCVSLDGAWEFALDEEARWHTPGEVPWSDTRIQVPFAPETQASGIHVQGLFRACWYRRLVTPLPHAPGERLVLRFGAVDYRATVWVGDAPCAEHEGGYTPFAVDVTRQLARGPALVTVRADDDPLDLAKPRGKQDWLLEPHSIWYPRTSGIWQTVWLEVVPAASVATIGWTSDLTSWDLGLAAGIDGEVPPGSVLRLSLSVGGRPLVRDSYQVVAGDVHRRIALSDPGIDDSRNELLWSPESPTLIDAELELVDGTGNRLDLVRSYTALRSIVAQGDRIVLNGRPYPLRMVLDQGYWPASGMTAPSNDAFRRDIELTKAMGFNGARKHQKVEDPRYLHWADRLGLLVWAEMPSAYRFTRRSIDRVTREWAAVLARDASHPCIIAWVPFNESWGVPNLPDNPAERHWVRALYHLTRTYDGSRLVVGNDGWESVATDVIGIHDYDDDPELIARRYHSQEVRPKLFRHARPGGRMLVVGGDALPEHPVVLSEFGGIACSPHRQGTWGYARADDARALASAYRSLLETVRSLDLLAGFCYTQLADTYQEANGLLYEDRTPKFPLEEIALATRGPRRPR
jgi:hypothetical protein